VPAESDQAHRTARVLTLLDESWQLWEAGDQMRSTVARIKASDVDPVVVLAVKTGMILGEIPDPARDYPAWAGYVESAREAAEDLAAREYTDSEQCDDCEGTGQNCPLHDGPEWRDDDGPSV